MDELNAFSCSKHQTVCGCKSQTLGLDIVGEKTHLDIDSFTTQQAVFSCRLTAAAEVEHHTPEEPDHLFSYTG